MGFFSSPSPVTMKDSSRYISHTDGIVIDKFTGLVWPEKDSGLSFYSHDVEDYCQNLRLAEYSNWRLPTAKELKNLCISNVCRHCVYTSGDMRTIHAQKQRRPFWEFYDKSEDVNFRKSKYSRYYRIFLSTKDDYSSDYWALDESDNKSLVVYNISKAKIVLKTLYPNTNVLILPVHDL